MRLSGLGSSVLLVGLALSAVPASADGLYLKLATETARVQGARPVKVKLTAVATRSFALPAVPVFVIDDGTGTTALTEVEVKAVDGGASQVSADAPASASWELVLPHPGNYKIRARYKLADRVVESNKIAVEVLTATAAE
jgi:hypothetical protein